MCVMEFEETVSYKITKHGLSVSGACLCPRMKGTFGYSRLSSLSHCGPILA